MYMHIETLPRLTLLAADLSAVVYAGSGAAYSQGDTVPVDITLTNYGSSRVGASYWVSVALSQDNVFGNEDDVRVVDQVSSTRLSAGQSTTVNAQFTMPHVTSIVPFYLLAKADSTNKIGEFDENNNVAIDEERSVRFVNADGVLPLRFDTDYGNVVSLTKSGQSLEIYDRSAYTTYVPFADYSSIWAKFGPGSDTLYVHVDGVYAEMGEGNDRVYDNYGSDSATVLGNAGNDFLTMGEGNDRAVGGPGKDTLIGGGGRDRLDGGNGNDLLLGYSGSDYLTGGLGHDTLVPGRGNDRIYAVDGYTDNVLGMNSEDPVREVESFDRLGNALDAQQYEYDWLDEV